MTAKNDEGQREQAKHKRVFFRFGDDLAVNDNPHRAVRLRRKPGSKKSVIVGSRKEVADGFVDDAGANPSRRIPAGIRQTAPRNANP